MNLGWLKKRDRSTPQPSVFTQTTLLVALVMAQSVSALTPQEIMDRAKKLAQDRGHQAVSEVHVASILANEAVADPGSVESRVLRSDAELSPSEITELSDSLNVLLDSEKKRATLSRTDLSRTDQINQTALEFSKKRGGDQMSVLDLLQAVAQEDRVAPLLPKDLKTRLKAENGSHRNPFARRLLREFPKILYDMVESARKGEYSQVVGREAEFEPFLMRVLNPESPEAAFLWTGQSGVGKTALTERFAQYLAETGAGDLLGLNIGEVMSSTNPVAELSKILVVLQEARQEANEAQHGRIWVAAEEIHRLLKAADKGTLPTHDTANTLKPAIARGKLRLLGDTTIAEFKLISADPALESRVSAFPVSEPNFEKALLMVRSYVNAIINRVKPTPRFTHEAVKLSVQLATRYVPQEYHPRKGRKLLKDAFGIWQHQRDALTPPGVGILNDEVLTLENLILTEEENIQTNPLAVLKVRQLEQRLRQAKGEREKRINAWSSAKTLRQRANEIVRKVGQLEIELGSVASADELPQIESQLRDLRASLESTQNELKQVGNEFGFGLEAVSPIHVRLALMSLRPDLKLQDSEQGILSAERFVESQMALTELEAEQLRRMLCMADDHAIYARPRVVFLVGPPDSGKEYIIQQVSRYFSQEDPEILNLREYSGDDEMKVVRLFGAPEAYRGENRGRLNVKVNQNAQTTFVLQNFGQEGASVSSGLREILSNGEKLNPYDNRMQSFRNATFIIPLEIPHEIWNRLPPAPRFEEREQALQAFLRAIFGTDDDYAVQLADAILETSQIERGAEGYARFKKAFDIAWAAATKSTTDGSENILADLDIHLSREARNALIEIAYTRWLENGSSSLDPIDQTIRTYTELEAKRFRRGMTMAEATAIRDGKLQLSFDSQTRTFEWRVLPFNAEVGCSGNLLRLGKESEVDNARAAKAFNVPRQRDKILQQPPPTAGTQVPGAPESTTVFEPGDGI